MLHSQAHLHSSFGAAVATPAPRGKNNDAARFADIFLSRKGRETVSDWIDSVQGRVINLISWIITIKFVKNTGEFNETKKYNVIIIN